MKARLTIPALLVFYHATFLVFIAFHDGDTIGYFQKHIPLYIGTAIFMVPVVRGYRWALILAAVISAYKAANTAFTMPYGLPAFNWLSIVVNSLVAVLASFFLFRVTREEQGGRPKPVQHNAGSRPSSGDSPASETPSSLGPRG